MAKTPFKIAAIAALYLIITAAIFAKLLTKTNLAAMPLLITYPAAALGTYLLCKAFNLSTPPSLTAAAIYAFSPIAISTANYHWTGTFLLASIPWLTLPAVLIPASNRTAIIIRPLLWTVPLIAVYLFFKILTLPGIGPFFPIPIEPLNPAHLHQMIDPTSKTASILNPSIGRIALIIAITGTVAIFSTQYLPIFITAAISIIFASMAVPQIVPPHAWLMIASLTAAITAAFALENLMKKTTTAQITITAAISALALAAITALQSQTITAIIYFVTAAAFTAICTTKTKTALAVIALITVWDILYIAFTIAPY